MVLGTWYLGLDTEYLVLGCRDLNMNGKHELELTKIPCTGMIEMDVIPK